VAAGHHAVGEAEVGPQRGRRGQRTRLLDMGVEDYLLTSTVNGILGQRLLRKLDRASAESYEALPEVVREFGLEKLTTERPIKLFKPVPSQAYASGYYGRTTIMEFLVMSDSIRRLIMQHAGMGEIEAQARADGMRTMYEDGLVKALDGQTTIEESLRVTQEG
jgi:general secretion pathway protein E